MIGRRKPKIDSDKILRAYMSHLLNQKGSLFLGGALGPNCWLPPEAVPELTVEEKAHLVRMRDDLLGVPESWRRAEPPAPVAAESTKAITPVSPPVAPASQPTRTAWRPAETSRRPNGASSFGFWLASARPSRP